MSDKTWLCYFNQPSQIYYFIYGQWQIPVYLKQQDNTKQTKDIHRNYEKLNILDGEYIILLNQIYEKKQLP